MFGRRLQLEEVGEAVRQHLPFVEHAEPTAEERRAQELLDEGMGREMPHAPVEDAPAAAAAVPAAAAAPAAAPAAAGRRAIPRPAQ
jgi:hypothetical protein